MRFNSDPEGKRLPIKLDSTSNGEFVPIPLDATNRRANRLAQTWASENAKRRGVDRRTFMVSACGAASTLLAFNAANAAAGRTGGFFEVDEVAAVDPEVALDRLGGASSSSTCRATSSVSMGSARPASEERRNSLRISFSIPTPT